jgi:hypothetical protein
MEGIGLGQGRRGFGCRFEGSWMNRETPGLGLEWGTRGC